MNSLVMNNFEIASPIGDIRNAMGMKIEDIAAETGYGLERIKEIENGGEATLAEMRDIALTMCTGTHCVRGDYFFSTQFSARFRRTHMKRSAAGEKAKSGSCCRA